MLKEKGRLTLQVERNLEGDISHNVPDISIDGKLTSVHFQLDVKQYKMVRGFLAHNFGEDLEPFQTPMMSQLQDPQIHVCNQHYCHLGEPLYSSFTEGSNFLYKTSLYQPFMRMNSCGLFRKVVGLQNFPKYRIYATLVIFVYVKNQSI